MRNSLRQSRIIQVSSQSIKVRRWPKKFDDKLLTLFFKEPLAEIKELNPVIREDGGWTRIKGIMDSGASESVAHPGMTPEYEVQESPGSKAGQKYTCANGETIENLGEKILDVVMDDGVETTIKYQACDVKKPLNSVSEICDAGDPENGQYVIFSKWGGAIVNPTTGRHVPFERELGVYTMGMWVKPKTVFTRQV